MVGSSRGAPGSRRQPRTVGRSPPLVARRTATKSRDPVGHRRRAATRSLRPASRGPLPISGLPGPRANAQLAWAVGSALASEGARADALVAELVAIDAQRAPAGNAAEFLPVVAAFALVARYLAGYRPGPTLEQLRVLAEDTRHLVRSGVVQALEILGRGHQGDFG